MPFAFCDGRGLALLLPALLLCILLQTVTPGGVAIISAHFYLGVFKNLGLPSPDAFAVPATPHGWREGGIRGPILTGNPDAAVPAPA